MRGLETATFRFAQAHQLLLRFVTPAVAQIILIECGTYVAIRIAFLVLPGPRVYAFIETYLALNPYFLFPVFFIWQVLTYLFVHLDALNLIFNILALWLFAVELESRWGSSRFMRFFLSVGVAAALMQQGIVYFTGMEKWPVFGASSVLWGIILAFVSYYPNRIVLYTGGFPLVMKYLVPAIALAFYVISIVRHDRYSSTLLPLTGLGAAYIYLSNFHRTADIRRWKYLP